MSTGGQMALGHVHCAGHRSTRTCYDLAGKAGRLLLHSGLSRHMGTEA